MPARRLTHFAALQIDKAGALPPPIEILLPGSIKAAGCIRATGIHRNHGGPAFPFFDFGMAIGKRKAARSIMVGAGTIFRDRSQHSARGLTTAASLLTVAPIGVAVALERYILAAGATLLALFVLRVVFWGETRLKRPGSAPALAEEMTNEE